MELQQFYKEFRDLHCNSTRADSLSHVCLCVFGCRCQASAHWWGERRMCTFHRLLVKSFALWRGWWMQTAQVLHITAFIWPSAAEGKWGWADNEKGLDSAQFLVSHLNTSKTKCVECNNEGFIFETVFLSRSNGTILMAKRCLYSAKVFMENVCQVHISVTFDITLQVAEGFHETGIIPEVVQIG